MTALGGRPEFWPPFQAAMSKFALDLPMELRLASQVHADPARTSAAMLAQIDDAVASLAGETDQVRILTISSADPLQRPAGGLPRGAVAGRA